ncbi:hypothetical protein O3S80_04345 [Streptomyces sp. Lzd4kr]|nr:hypothetical protein [Streptomyces sp. Lzd4kr]
MTAPGPGVLSTGRFVHGAAPVAHEQTVWWGLSDIDSTCPPANETHREAGCNCPTRCNIPLAGHQGHEEVTGTLGHAPDPIRIVDGPADGEVLRHRSLNCCLRPAATNARDSLARLSHISTELLGALSAWASPLSDIFRQHMQQGKERSQAIHEAHNHILLLVHHKRLSRSEAIDEAVRKALSTVQSA